MLSNFIKDDGVNFIFTGHYMEIYIPEYFFDYRFSEIEGSAINTFGVLPCVVFDKNNKKINSYTINLPTFIILRFKDIRKDKKTLSDAPDAEPEACRVVSYYTNDIIMASSIEKNSSYAERFIHMMLSAKISNIPYNRLLEVWEKNLQINGVKLGVSASILEIIIAEIYRDKSNPDKKFSDTLDKNPKTSQYAYHASNIQEICSRNSTFAALSFENMDAMLTSSLNMTKYNKEQVESPIEKILKY